MNTKKNIVIVCLLSMVFFVMSCGKDTVEQNNAVEDVNTSESEKAITDADILEQTTLDLDKYSLKSESDDSSDMHLELTYVSKSEYGYYFYEIDHSNGMFILMFYEPESGQAIPLCSRPDCRHNSEECNACFINIYLDKEEYLDSYLQYYDGFLYVIGVDPEYNVSLYRVSADGSSREKYMHLYKADVTSIQSDSSLPGNQTHFRHPDVYIYQDYVYYIDSKEMLPKIRRMKLGTDETEIIFESDVERAMLYRMHFYGDYLFFQTAHYTDDSYSELDGGIYAYNIQNGEMSLVKKDAIAPYCVYDKCLYYNNLNGISKFNLESGEDIVIVSDEELIFPYVNEQYIIVYSDDSVVFYAHSGEEMYRVSTKDLLHFSGGDSRFIFASAAGKIAILDLSGIEEQKGGWKLLSDN